MAILQVIKKLVLVEKELVFPLYRWSAWGVQCLSILVDSTSQGLRRLISDRISPQQNLHFGRGWI